MWRFILVSFAFLGWAFYVLSGGSDYRPASGSLQDPDRAGPRAEAVTSGPAAAESPVPEAAPGATAQQAPDAQAEEAAQMAELLATLRASNDATATTMTRESAPAAPEAGVAAESEPAPAATAPADAGRVEVQFTSALEAFANAAPVTPTESRPTGDFRQVVGSRVNLRTGPGTGFGPVDQLVSGTEVEVLGQDGDWLELRVPATGASGWMSRRLVTEAAD